MGLHDQAAQVRNKLRGTSLPLSLKDKIGTMLISDPSEREKKWTIEEGMYVPVVEEEVEELVTMKPVMQSRPTKGEIALKVAYATAIVGMVGVYAFQFVGPTEINSGNIISIARSSHFFRDEVDLFVESYGETKIFSSCHFLNDSDALSRKVRNGDYVTIETKPYQRANKKQKRADYCIDADDVTVLERKAGNTH